MLGTMPKKKAVKAVLSIEIDAALKERIRRLAEHRDRKLNAEVARALHRYLEEEEAKEGLSADAD